MIGQTFFKDGVEFVIVADFRNAKGNPFMKPKPDFYANPKGKIDSRHQIELSQKELDDYLEAPSMTDKSESEPE